MGGLDADRYIFWVYFIISPKQSSREYDICKPSHFLLDQCDYKKKSLLSCPVLALNLIFIHPCVALSIALITI